MTSDKLAPGERDLTTLLTTMTTVLHPDTFVFITLPASSPAPPSLPIQMSFHEAEGLTLISTQSAAAEHGLDYAFPCRMITLNVHSSLEAVGFIAVVAGRLKDLGMGVNPVSGFYHDHLFVPLGREEAALEALRDLVEEAKSRI
jgi:hypothetical protein